MSSYEAVAYTSRPVGVSSGGQEQTLLQALQHILPQCFMLENVETQEGVDQFSKISTAASDTTRAASQSDQDMEVTFLQAHVVLIAGIRPPLQTPLISLHAALHAADMFLYITVIVQ